MRSRGWGRSLAGFAMRIIVESKDTNMKIKTLSICMYALLLSSPSLFAQQSSEQLSKEAANPLADLMSFRSRTTSISAWVSSIGPEM